MNPAVLPADVVQLCAQYAAIPYENLSKVLALHTVGAGRVLDQLPDQMTQGAPAGGGATCFPLCWGLRERLRLLGYTSRLLMAHRGRQHNRHCSLSWDWDGNTYLLDPGYLIPVPLQVPKAVGEVSEFPLVPNRVRLQRTAEGVELWTGYAGEWRYRYTHGLGGVSIGEFFSHWQASYSWEMMNYPVLNRLDLEHGVQYYYQKEHLLIRGVEGVQRIYLAPEERAEQLAKVFRLSRDLVESALRIGFSGRA